MMSWSACLRRSATDKLGPPVTAKPIVSYTTSWDIILKVPRFEVSLFPIKGDACRENIKSLFGAGFGVSLMADAGIGDNYPGVTYREIRDGNGPSRISYTAHWRGDNHNPALANFITLLKERYPSPAGFD